MTRALWAFVALAACTPPAEGEGEGEGEAEDFGFVFVVDEPTLGFAQAGAVFRRELPRAFDCTETAVAGCTLLECGAEPLEFDEVDAGDIDVTGALVPIALRFDGTYSSVDEGPLFTGGEALSATGSGDPAFALAVTAPTAATITEPVWPAQQDVLTVARADGLHLAWTGDAGDVVITFNTADQSTELSCAFPASAGSADVPAEALLAMPEGDGFVDIEVSDVDVARVDTWQIQLEAATHALAGDEPAIASTLLE